MFFDFTQNNLQSMIIENEADCLSVMKANVFS